MPLQSSDIINSKFSKSNYTLQISLDLCIPEKELAKTRSQISFIYFQSHS
jgi:hypothetical protein